MRDIKFRAWHKGQNKMYPAEEMGRDELTIATDGRGFVNVSEDGPQFSEYITDMIPLQYTGMKDKNGVEIYVGDRLQTVLDDGTRLSTFVIEWDVDYARFVMIREPDNERFNINPSVSLKEVIGNIYEQEPHT